MTIRARFDGTVIVPDEPVNLPVNAPIELWVMRINGVSPEMLAAEAEAKDPAVIARKLEALKQFIEHGVRDAHIPAEALRRENMDDDDGR